ncbi:hypothetical protein PG993_015224 [Apiospora rasikravindrae]|uniref:Uncharacterized protein n=1 Tax=Apiospora rasikravindrae TaxID=990691 RepID=A0ABR1RQ20_9PEZI
MCKVIYDQWHCGKCNAFIEIAERQGSWSECDIGASYNPDCPRFDPTYKYHHEYNCDACIRSEERERIALRRSRR